MDSQITTWREWELSADWTRNAVCPDCGGTLIITHLITEAHDDEASDIHNGICPHCRKQYTVASDHGTLTPNLQASEQQDRIDALEIRVARLEAIVQTLTARQSVPTHPPLPEEPKADPEAEAFKRKYGYLF